MYTTTENVNKYWKCKQIVVRTYFNSWKCKQVLKTYTNSCKSKQTAIIRILNSCSRLKQIHMRHFLVISKHHEMHFWRFVHCKLFWKVMMMISIFFNEWLISGHSFFSLCFYYIICEDTLFEKYSKCRIWILEFWHFPPIFVL